MTKAPTPYSRKQGRAQKIGRPADQGPTMREIHDAEMEAVQKLADERAANYKAAWEAEKQLNEAMRSDLGYFRDSLAKARARAFLGGVIFGGFMVGLLGWLCFLVLIK